MGRKSEKQLLKKLNQANEEHAAAQEARSEALAKRWRVFEKLESQFGWTMTNLVCHEAEWETKRALRETD